MSDGFRNYDHVERYGRPDVQNLNAGAGAFAGMAAGLGTLALLHRRRRA